MTGDADVRIRQMLDELVPEPRQPIALDATTGSGTLSLGRRAGAMAAAACVVVAIAIAVVVARPGGRGMPKAAHAPHTASLVSTAFANSGVALTHDPSWRYYSPTQLHTTLATVDGYLSTVVPQCAMASGCTPAVSALGPADVLVGVGSAYIADSAGGGLSGGGLSGPSPDAVTIDGYSGSLDVAVAPRGDVCPSGTQFETFLDLGVPDSKPNEITVIVCSGSHLTDVAVSGMIHSIRIAPHQLPFVLPPPHDFGPAVSRVIDDVIIESPAKTDHPGLTWEQAVAACEHQSCNPVNAEVTLGRVTTTNSGAAQPNGSIEPLLEHQLVYILDWPGEVCVAAGSVPPTSYASKGNCQRFSFLDANTGQVLFTFSHSG
jgi:hypothetical protein